MESGSVTAQAAPTGGKKKRFECKHCQRMFARLEHLQRHERIHTQEKPFSCALCNYSFTRSDLLVRHERLTHQKENSQRRNSISENAQVPPDARSNKRRRTSLDDRYVGVTAPSALSSPIATFNANFRSQSLSAPANVNAAPSLPQNDEFSLAALSMAAEYQALQGNMPDSAPQHHDLPPSITLTEEMPIDRPLDVGAPSGPEQSHENAFGDTLDSLAAFLDNEPLSTYHFSSLIHSEQPMPFFSPESFSYGHDVMHPPATPGAATVGHGQSHFEDPSSISRFGSRLPSLQPEEASSRPLSQRRPISDVSFDDRQRILARLSEFSSVLPADFRLPSKLALSRYIAAYINGFHEHMPFLHLPSMSIETCSIELILAMAAVGTQYTFESEKGVEIFNASRAIATHRIRRRDTRLVQFHERGTSELSSTPREAEGRSTSRSSPRACSTFGPLGLPSEPEPASLREDLMQTAQALFLLMALSTWAKHKEILREALAIQSILATLIRDDGLSHDTMAENASWEDWIKFETTKRTKFLVFSFFNLHCIVYNIPPLILTSELRLTLPCSAAEFKAPNATAWKEARSKATSELGFQEALQKLFTRGGRDITEFNSSLGNYVLIHALIQQIFFVRQVAKCRFDGSGDLTPEDHSRLEHALRNWQLGWKSNPESSLDPMDPNGPIAFNSTALLRLAWIRLNVDTAGRALDTRDPVQIARAFREAPPIKRSQKLIRPALHAAHALSIPVKIGIRLVAKTQTFIWSIQHSLCTLECGYLLSKWLEAMSTSNPDQPVTDDERKIISIVKTLMDETEFAVPPEIPQDSPAYTKYLSAGVLRVWATIFKGAQTWAIVDVIGSSLNLYADMLEAG